MASGATPLRARPYPVAGDTPSVHTDLQALATSLDTAPVVGQGILSARPAASAAGNRYYVTGDGTAANNGIEWLDTGATWIQVSHANPVGAIMNWAGAADPADTSWLICDGRAISRSTYAALFGVIASTYGNGDGSTTFNIPDVRGRVPIGAGTGAGLTSRTLAATGGEETHQLTTAEIASHTHAIPSAAVNPGGTIGSHVAASGPDFSAPQAIGVNNWQGGSPNTGSAGSGGTHNNMQPYLVLNHIIRVL